MKDRPTPLPGPAVRHMREAVAAQQRGDSARAEALYQGLTRLYPGFADAWHYRGLLAHQQGRESEALDFLQHAQGLAPDNFIFLLNFGRVLRETGQFARSVACLERARQIEPNHAQALVLLAQSLLAIERGGELVPEIVRHLERAGNDWHLWMLLGECRQQAGDRDGALAAFEEAARLAPPGETSPHLRRADAARSAHDNTNALCSLEAALRIDGACSEARSGLANLAAEAGDFARAEALAREALAFDARAYMSWDLIASVTPKESLPQLAEELERAAESAGADPRAWPLHFARGRTWEKLTDYDRAFGAYAAGNRIRASMRPYSRETQSAYSLDFIASLDASFIDRSAEIGVLDPGVIFVCGMPRSGTTLVETILASHPTVTAGGEQRFIHDWLRRELGTVGMARTGNWLRNLPNTRLKEVARQWHQDLSGKAASHRYITDKMPGNYAMMGLLHVCFPSAPIVHVRRDSRDNCFSCYAMSFAEGHAFSYTLETTGHYYRLHDALVDHWKQVLPPRRIIEVEYERLVGEPETEIRRLLETLGLEWDSRCLNFHETRRTVATASLFQVRQPIYTSSIGRWRHFEPYLGPLLAELDSRTPL